MAIEDEIWLLAHSDEPEDKKEWAVLYWKSQGLKHQEIADKWNYGTDWVQRYMTRAYKRFGTPKELNKNEKMAWLEENVFPALRRFIEQHPEVVKELPEPPEEASTISVFNKQNKTVPVSINTRTKVNLFFLFIAILIAVAGVGGYWAGNRNLAPVPTVTTEATEAWSTSVAFPTLAPIIYPTSTETPINFTPVPIETVIPTDTPNPNVFYFNFDDGIGEGWTVLFGNPIVVNGKLTASETTAMTFGSPDWKNYEISFDTEMVNGCKIADISNAVGIRVQDVDNMVIYIVAGCESEWSLLTNGIRKPIPGTFTGNGGNTAHFTITVEDDKVSLHRGSVLLNSFIGDVYQTGYIYLRIREGNIYDNFTITLLP